MLNNRSSPNEIIEAYLYGRINYERRDDSADSRDLRFETILQFLGRRGNPHLHYPTIHVAGTKGKGSVASMIAAMLRAAGYRTGVYGSPHLESIHERLVVDQQQITDAEFCGLIESLRADVAVLDQQSSRRADLHPPTFFEILTVAAFEFFSLRKVDVAVIEVGVGGRLDSTNVCQPAATVITSIGLDHQRLLGATRSLIAAEKAGIIKPGVGLICGVQQRKPASVIGEIAREKAAPSFWLGKDFRCKVSGDITSFDDRTTFDTWGTVGVDYNLQGCESNLIGRHQACNAAVAIATLQWLVHQGWKIDSAAIRRGLSTVDLPGRFQIFAGEPNVVLDIAHNEISVCAFVRTLRERFGTSSAGRVLIFSASRDKKISKMLSHLLPYFERVILTKIVGNPRGCELPELQAIAEMLLGKWSDPQRPTPKIEIAVDSEQAWGLALRGVSAGGCVAVTGSAFLVGQMLPIVRRWESRAATSIEQV